MEVLYIDSFFVLSLITDYLLCLAAGRICGLRLKRSRYFPAAVFGSAYAAAVFLPGLGFLASPLVKLSAGLVMGLIAYGAETHPLRCTAVFFAVSAAFGGAIWAVSLAAGKPAGSYAALDTKTLILAFALCYAGGSLLLRCRARLMEKKRVTVRAVFLGRAAEFIALVDTGNTLSDPATGAPVMLACPKALKTIFRDDTALFSASPVELIELTSHIPELRGRLRLVPYSAVGSSGLLPVFRPESLTVDGTPDRELLIAVSPDAAGDGFDALL